MRALLLLASCLALLGTAILVGRSVLGGGQGRRLQLRITDVSRPYAPARAVSDAGSRKNVLPAIPPQILAGVLAAFGARAEHTDRYPAPPAVIVAAATVPALLVALYLGTSFGGWARASFLPIWCLLCRLFFGRCHSRRSAALYRQLPDSLAMVVRAVRAGVPVVEALRTVGREVPEPTGGEFRILSDQMAIGIGLETALRALARRSGLPEYDFFAVAVTLHNSAGGNLTETLESLAEVIRKRVAMRQRGIALASQANASAYILAAVPVVTSLALLVINPGYIMTLFDDPRGKVLFAIAVAMLLGGLGVMRMMITRALS